MEDHGGKIAEIATATVEQAANAQEVSKAIQSVAQVTEQSAAGSEEMASSSEELVGRPPRSATWWQIPHVVTGARSRPDITTARIEPGKLTRAIDNLPARGVKCR